MKRGEKTRCGGAWTESRFSSFIKSALRAASSRWGPKYACLKRARVARGLYKCETCPAIVGPKEIKADHIEPVVSVRDGFIDWNTYIKRLFVEIDGFRALCVQCHAKITLEQNLNRK